MRTTAGLVNACIGLPDQRQIIGFTPRINTVAGLVNAITRFLEQTQIVDCPSEHPPDILPKSPEGLPVATTPVSFSSKDLAMTL